MILRFFLASGWQRAWIHKDCLDDRYWCLVVRQAGAMAAYPSKRDRSATVLLILQELGLPYDVAWPIAALACWVI